MITVNGQEYNYQPEMTIKDVLDLCGYVFPLIIVKLDGIFVPRNQYEDTAVWDGATIDAIHLIAGG